MSKQKKGAVLITGASTGIGRASALLLDRLEYRVFAGVRKAEAGKSLKAEGSDSLTPVTLDITRAKQIASAVEAVKKALGADLGLTGLVNNAGIAIAGPIEFLPIDVLRRQLEVNFVGHVAVTQAFLPLIRKGHGRIINIGSATGRFALPFLGAYSASKSAMEALTDALRRELQPWGIPVSIVQPGTVETPMWDKSIAETSDLRAHLPAYAKEPYEKSASSMARVMENGRRCAIPSEAVAKVVREVLETRRPKTRYVVGAGARMAVIAGFLPDRLTDWVISRVLAKKLPTKVLGW